MKKNEQSLQEIWDYVKRPNLRLVSVLEDDGDNKSKLENTLQDITQENIRNITRQANIQIQKKTESTSKIFHKKSNPKAHNRQIHQGWNEKKNVKGSQRERSGYHKGKPIRLTANFSVETLEARREWGPIFNILKEKNFQPRISYPAKLSFISKREIKSSADKQMLRNFVSTRPALQDLLKDGKEKLVPATAKTCQIIKTIDTMKKLHQLTGKITS